MQRVLSLVRKCIAEYKMIENGDVIAVGVSGGKDSVILLEQMRTIDKKRLGEKMGHLDDETMNAVNDAITISLGLRFE